jgi:anti-sigma factor RsiW
MKLTKDNPLLTAYALGELAPGEAAEVERAILAIPSANDDTHRVAAYFLKRAAPAGV